MDSFSYHNIFETKGMEYLIIIGFLILLIPFAWLLNRKGRNLRGALPAGNTASPADTLPRGVFLNRNHTWMHLSRSGRATVGIDGLVARLIGDLRLAFLKSPGDPVHRGEPLVEFRMGERSLVLSSPLTGTVSATHDALQKETVWASEDPYGRGWICRVDPDNWKADTSQSYLSDSAVRWSASEIYRFRDFLAARFSPGNPGTTHTIMQDGGALTGRLLTEMPPNLWLAIEEEFLKI